MDQVLAGFVAVSILLGLAGVGGVIFANLRSSALEASNRRLTSDNEYYLRKVGYQDTAIGKLENEVDSVKRENATLRTLANPAAAIDALREQEADNHLATYAMLQAIHNDLQRQLGDGS